MKKIITLAGLLFVCLFFSGCGKKDKNNLEDKSVAKTKWSFEKTISDNIKGVSNDKDDLILGDLENNKISFVVSGGSFDENAEVSLANPTEVPDYNGNIMEPLGSPIDISAGENKRMNEKATVIFKFDSNKLPTGDEIYQVRVAYYDGEKWDYVKPAQVDKEKGLITFETYHFSLLGPVKVKDETKITEDWIHSQAVDSVLRDQINNEVDNVASQITDMIMAKMGITDGSSRGKVMSELLNSDSYKDIYNEYQKGNTADASQKLALLAGEKIAENVPESVFSKALGDVAGSADDIAKVSQAAGYAAEGQYKEAAKIIGEQIADKFLITTAGKIAVEMVDYQIQSWKNSEVEAAYEAYKKGADGVFWGYNVDPGDFDGVWLQMRGIRRQLELEMIKKENGFREDAGMPELTERQEELMRASLKEKYRKQFAERVKKDEEIKKAEDQLRILVKAFKEKGMFERDELGKDVEFEQKLEVLNHFAKKMMRDTNKNEVLDKDVTLKEGAITSKNIALGASIYFSKPDGKEKYKEYLQSNFGINPYPDLKNLKGDWEGTVTITDVYVSEDLKQQSQNKTDGGNSEEGECDFSMNLEELIGQTNPFSMSIYPNGENAGTIKIGSDSEDKKSSNFTYNNGLISAPFAEKGATGSMELTITENDNGYDANGAINISYEEGKAKITATVSLKKGK